MAGIESSAVNPLIGGSAVDTVDHCREVLNWMALCKDDEGGCDFGRSLVLRTISGALEHANEQHEIEIKGAAKRLEVVRG